MITEGNKVLGTCSHSLNAVTGQVVITVGNKVLGTCSQSVIAVTGQVLIAE